MTTIDKGYSGRISINLVQELAEKDIAFPIFCAVHILDKIRYLFISAPQYHSDGVIEIPGSYMPYDCGSYALVDVEFFRTPPPKIKHIKIVLSEYVKDTMPLHEELEKIFSEAKILFSGMVIQVSTLSVTTDTIYADTEIVSTISVTVDTIYADTDEEALYGQCINQDVSYEIIGNRAPTLPAPPTPTPPTPALPEALPVQQFIPFSGTGQSLAQANDTNIVSGASKASGTSGATVSIQDKRRAWIESLKTKLTSAKNVDNLMNGGGSGASKASATNEASGANGANGASKESFMSVTKGKK